MIQYLLIVVVFTLATFTMSAPTVIVAEVASDLVTSTESLGTLGGIAFLLYAAAQLPAGFIVDRFGVRHAVYLCLAVSLAGNLIFALAPNYPVALVGRMVTGFGAGLVVAPLLKVVSATFSARSFTLAWGIGFSLAYGGGSVLATAPLTIAADVWNWRVPFLLLCVLLALVLLAQYGLVRRPARVGPGTPPDRRPERLPVRTQLLVGLATWWGSPSLRAYATVLFISAGTFTAFQALWLGPYLSQVRSMDSRTYGTVLLAMAAGLTVGYGLAGHLSKRLGRTVALVRAGVLAYAALWAVLSLQREAGGVLLITILVTVMGLTLGFVTIGFGLVPAHVDQRTAGIVTGVVNTMPFVGSALFQVGIGYLVTHGSGPAVSGAGYRNVFLLFAALNLGALAIGSVMSERPGRTDLSRV